MQLAFEIKSLRTICESEVQANSELGSDVAEILKHRLADLRAATTINDLVAGRSLIVDDANQEQMIINLQHGYRIVFCANHTKNPTTETGETDWTKVSRIKILRIDKSNDN